jgi:hypothetical protein
VNRQVREIGILPAFVHGPRMAKRNITLELDAYEKLRFAKRPGETFTEVVRRARFEAAAATGASLRQYFRDGGRGVREECLEAIEAAEKSDQPEKHP